MRSISPELKNAFSRKKIWNYVIVSALSLLLLTGMDSFASNSVSAISEMAPLDVVLVIDASDSMTYDAPADLADPNHYLRDPFQCNPAHNCHPFEDIKTAVAAFVEKLNFPNDRVAIVTFDDGAHVDLGFSIDAVEIQNAIGALEVVEPDVCNTTTGPCREYERDAQGNIIDLDGDGIGDQYLGFRCPIYNLTGNPDTCGTTSIGKGLLFAANEFFNEGSGSRRVVILLTDGAANGPFYACPPSTWISPFCRDHDATTRHCFEAGDISCLAAGGVYDPNKYDADDYARDMVDFLSEDQGAFIYTIGLGPLVQTSIPIDSNGWGAGEQLLRYAAEIGSGAFYFAPSGEQLEEIFQDIYSHLSSGPKTWIVTKTDDTNDGSCDEDCSLREAVASASAGDTVTFAPSLAGQTIALDSAITINTDLTIDGSNLASHVQVSGDTDNDGMGDTSVFMIAAGTVVETADLDIIAGHYTEALAAGGINNYGDLTLTNCSFSGNTGDQGGAVHNKGSLTVSNCSFTGNTAVEGGAILNDVDGTALIFESTFANNTASYPDSPGGAAGAVANVGTLMVYDSIFTNNSANAGGAIVNSFAGSTTVQGSTFTGNAVLMDIDFNNANSPGYGGAIYNYSGTLTVNNSTFSDNVADGGAAISIGNNDPYSTEESLLVIENSTFSGNTAGFIGGGVNIYSGTATISTSTFINNSAEGGGGGGVVNSGSLTLISTTFDSNIGGDGGGVVNIGSLTVNNSNFIQNVAAISVGSQGEGAAGAIVNMGTATVSESTFSGNSAEGGGGAIVNSDNGDLGVTLDVTDSIFTNNSTPKYGGAIYNFSGTLTVAGSTFTDNSAELGGAINVWNNDIAPEDGTATISTSTFINNSAGDGGGVFNMGSLTVDNSNFSQNVAAIFVGGEGSGAAGAIANWGIASISGSTFSGNSAEGGGGAIGNSNNGDLYGGTLDVTDSIFTNNSTPKYGGAIYNYSGMLSVSGSTFTDNTAEYGGAINIGNFDNVPTDGNVTVDHSLFSENTASYIAGGVHIFGMDATISGCTFVDNSAEYGGGLVAILGTHNISNSTFYNNSSSEDPGGGIVNGGTLTLTNSTFSDNIGGGLYNLPDGSLSLRNNILANSPSGVDCYDEGILTSETHNLIEVNGNGEFACGAPVSNDDPLLGPLADNGGPTWTMSLQPGSPAIDAGDDATCKTTDQRGVARPQGNHCDIGAYELIDNTSPTVLSVTRADPSPTSAPSVDFTVTFSEAVTGVDASDFALSVTGVTGASVTGVSGSGTTYTVTVNTGSGDGTIRLDVIDDDSIVDGAGNPLDGPGTGNGSYTGGEIYTIQKHNADTTGVFRPSNGLLYLKNTNTTGYADIAINYGTGGDYPVTGDWDGNGTDTIGIYRNGNFYLRNSNTLGFADLVFPFGTPGDQPIAGDWNGDGVDTIGVYRPSTGQFLLRNSNTAGAANMSFYLGNVGDVGIAGDWTAKGYDTVGVFRPSNGVIFLKNTNSTGFADIALNYGLPGDLPVTGDWDGDAIDTIGIYRNGVFYLRNSNTIGFADIVFGLGNPGDMPISGDWDGLP